MLKLLFDMYLNSDTLDEGIKLEMLESEIIKEKENAIFQEAQNKGVSDIMGLDDKVLSLECELFDMAYKKGIQDTLRLISDIMKGAAI